MRFPGAAVWPPVWTCERTGCETMRGACGETLNKGLPVAVPLQERIPGRKQWEITFSGLACIPRVSVRRGRPGEEIALRCLSKRGSWLCCIPALAEVHDSKIQFFLMHGRKSRKKWIISCQNRGFEFSGQKEFQETTPRLPGNHHWFVLSSNYRLPPAPPAIKSGNAESRHAYKSKAGRFGSGGGRIQEIRTKPSRRIKRCQNY